MSYALGSFAPMSLAEVREGKAVLKRGMYDNPAVKELQALLKVAVDGDFGPKTEAAVIAAQTKAGLPATGFVEAVTLAAIEGKLEAKVSLPKDKRLAIEKAKQKAVEKVRERAAQAKGTSQGLAMPSARTLALVGGGFAALAVLGLIWKRRRSA